MGLCDDLAEWDSMSPDERIDFLEGFINDYLDDEGYGPVTVESGPTEHKFGVWNEAENTVRFNEDNLPGMSASDGLDTAIHETTHAEKDFSGGHQDPADEDAVFEKDTVIFNDDGSTTLWPRGAPESAEHRDIYLYAQELTDMIMDACDEPEPESGAAKDLEPGDWELPEGDTGFA